MKIYIATVHWQSDYWINIQQKYLAKYVPAEYEIYACLNGISANHNKKFDYVNSEEIKDHGTKLNILAEKIIDVADDEDWILFLDGDAFPVADVVSLGKRELKNFPLIAVQRKENLGDVQPHPSFCLTTVKFWKEIKGDWLKGSFRWKNSEGRMVNDVGGTLLERMQKKNINWLALNRSNRVDLHPLMFGVYADCVYHHGTGFRKPASRIDKYVSAGFEQRRLRYEKSKRFLPYKLSRWLFSPYNRIIKENTKLNQQVLGWIQNEFDFYKRFM